MNKWPSKDGFKIGYINIAHLLNKLPQIPSILHNAGNIIHVFGISEARLNDKDTSESIAIQGYETIIRKSQNAMETGIVVYINQSVKFKRMEQFENHNVESIWLEIYLKNTKPILAGFLYRNPAERVNWRDRFISMMDQVTLESKEIILLGDFNIDLLKPQRPWIQTYESYNLTQLIDQPTRLKSGTSIDHIYVSTKDRIIETCVPVCGLSDHCPIFITWNKKGVKIPKGFHKIINCRNFSKFNEEDFLKELSQAPFNNVYQFNNPEEALTIWENIFLLVYNKHAPVQQKRVKHSPKPPWITKEIENAIHLREKLLERGNREEFKKQRNLVTSLLRKARKKYIIESVTTGDNNRSAWKAINLLTNKNSSKTSTSLNDITPDKLNQHFSSVADKIITSNKTNLNDLEELKQFCESKNSEPLNIPYLSVYEVYNSLLKLKQSKSRGMDGIDGKILKIAAPIISDSLTYIYNKCLEKNIFPKAFKIAKVVPLHKSGSKNDPTNYRPISLLSVLSKPLEKHLNYHILSHLNKNHFIHQCQSGFRKNHSCHTALINIMDSWLTNINRNEFTGVLYADFKKAFDMIDHNLLLKKLVCYNFSQNALKMIKSFLSDRRQLVLLDNHYSETLPINYGVPQGSILGPLLFSIYINDLPLFIKILCELFADDTTLHTHHRNLNVVIDTLQKTIERLLLWSELNHMCLHPNKTKYMIITSRQKRQNIPISLPQLHIGNDILEEVETHKVLGLTIDNNLSWGPHVSNLCKKVAQQLYQMSKLKHFLDMHSRKLFFNAFIQSNIDYASTIWDSSSENILKPLQSLHRRGIKLILLKSSSLDSSDYQKIDILPLKSRFLLNKGTMMQKIMLGRAPRALMDRFQYNESRHSHKLVIPLPRIDLYKTSLTYSGGTLWNNLPVFIKSTTYLRTFRKKFRKHLQENFKPP